MQSILWFQFNTIKLFLALVWTVEVQYNEVIRFRSHAKNSHLFFAEWVRAQMWAMWSEDGLRPDHLRTLNFSTCCTFQCHFFYLCLIWVLCISTYATIHWNSNSNVIKRIIKTTAYISIWVVNVFFSVFLVRFVVI